jgi:hypothetical protein
MAFCAAQALNSHPQEGTPTAKIDGGLAGAPRFPVYSILERRSTELRWPVDNSGGRRHGSAGPTF